MKEELTGEMHSEFSINRETEQKQRAGCVWDIVGFDAHREEIEKWASRYGVTYDVCMDWKSYWHNLHHNK